MKEPEIRQALQKLNRMEAGIQHTLDDLTGKELEYIDIVQAAKNEFKMKKTQEMR